MLASSYLADNSTLTIRLVCSTLGLSRSSFYAAKKAKSRNDGFDEKVWQSILKVWDKFPGWGYRKLAVKLKENGKRIRRILKKYRELGLSATGDGRVSSRGKTQSTRKYPNLIKKITKDLIT